MRDKTLRTEMAVYAVTEVGTGTGGVLFYGKMELLGLRMLPCGSRNSWRKSVLEEREREILLKMEGTEWACCVLSRTFSAVDMLKISQYPISLGKLYCITIFLCPLYGHRLFTFFFKMFTKR